MYFEISSLKRFMPLAVKRPESADYSITEIKHDDGIEVKLDELLVGEEKLQLIMTHLHGEHKDLK
jgi:cell division septal protein FtsQ